MTWVGEFRTFHPFLRPPTPSCWPPEVLVLLAIRALGKSKFVLCQVPSHNRRPESAVLYLVEHSSNVVPSINQLSGSEEGRSRSRAFFGVM